MRRVALAVVVPLLAVAACADSDAPREGGSAASTTSSTAPPISPTTSTTEPEPEHRYLLFTSDDVAALPANGPAWDALVLTARQELLPVLHDQDVTSAPAFAAALVYARTGEAEFRQRVEAALAQLPGTEAGGRTLSLGRQLAGWVLAADLIGYRDPAFLQWLDRVRTEEIGGHGRWRALTQTHETTASNWGTFAGASRIAASRFLGDRGDVGRAADVLRAWLGEPGAPPPAFEPSQDFDGSWACDADAWTAVNGPCGDRDGALVEDISRGEAHPAATDVGLQYSWEALQGAVLQAMLLAADGRSEVWEWGDEALRRSVDFLARNGGFDPDPFDELHHWVPWVIDSVYGTRYVQGPAGAGRSVGFTDWLSPVVQELGAG